MGVTLDTTRDAHNTMKYHNRCQYVFLRTVIDRAIGSPFSIISACRTAVRRPAPACSSRRTCSVLLLSTMSGVVDSVISVRQWLLPESVENLRLGRPRHHSFDEPRRRLLRPCVHRKRVRHAQGRVVDTQLWPTRRLARIDTTERWYTQPVDPYIWKYGSLFHAMYHLAPSEHPESPRDNQQPPAREKSLPSRPFPAHRYSFLKSAP